MRKAVVFVVLFALMVALTAYAGIAKASEQGQVYMWLNDKQLTGKVVIDRVPTQAPIVLFFQDKYGNTLFQGGTCTDAGGIFKVDIDMWLTQNQRKPTQILARASAGDRLAFGTIRLDKTISENAIHLQPGEAGLRVGETVQFKLIKETLQGPVDVTMQAKWDSEGGITQVGPGRFKASGGKAKVKAEYEGITATATVNVVEETPVRKIADSPLDRTFSPTLLLHLQPNALYLGESCQVLAGKPTYAENARLVSVDFPVAGKYDGKTFVPSEEGSGWVTVMYEANGFHFVDQAWIEVISPGRTNPPIKPAGGRVNWWFSSPDVVLSGSEAEFKVSAPDGAEFRAYRGTVTGKRQEGDATIITYRAPVVDQHSTDYITAYLNGQALPETISVSVDITTNKNDMRVVPLAPWLIYLGDTEKMVAKLETPVGPVVEKTTAKAEYGEITPSEFMPDRAGMFEFTYRAPLYRAGWDKWEFKTASGKTIQYGTWVQAKSPLVIWPEPEVVNPGGSSEIHGKFYVDVPEGTKVKLTTNTGVLAETVVATNKNGEFSTTLSGIEQTVTVTATAKVVSAAGNEQTFTASCEVRLKGEEAPPVENLPDGTIIDRMPGYLVLTKPVKMNNPGKEIILNYDPAKMDANPDRHPTGYYWHGKAKKWVALATYPAGAGKIKVINDGNYSGWFAVFGVIKPTFTDVDGHWAEQTANRMNSLGLLEGYPGHGLTRPAGLNRNVTRAEFTTVVARILGLNPGDLMYQVLKPLSESDADRVLSKFTDKVPKWAKGHIAAMVRAGLAEGRDDRFDGDAPITRIEAAVIVSRTLNTLPNKPESADLSKFADAQEVPDWAKKAVTAGIIGGYPDGTLRPNEPITRAEALEVLLRLLRALGW